MQQFILVLYIIAIYAAIAVGVTSIVFAVRRILIDVREEKHKKQIVDKLYTILFKAYLFDIEDDDYDDRYIKGWNDAVSDISTKLTNGRI